MKKTALTIGLFSLVAAATSFANPAAPIISSEKLSSDLPVDGSTGGGRKQDSHRIMSELVVKNNDLGFSNINQSVGTNKKVD
ncbi:hypothetical protein [Flavobacterium johnsoniae]|jgi:hypothetical protein|uniref:Uncharacterized protein n=1 Tax=Flavobacterium johnsoniae (strain ATCC 17061 / DSM 2064 / JCM 8514 / BCRC 14874 / CCUG 350202 / NBRC 14942 / NCIMB 11054 / UW101) TaxID=376686 RepID=A5FLU0_FLAJ1|nr:hypothetical protein [Flavobacterium johnsoniae]ABQ03828.1 hypothetical protein Fjoh_0794 [Flavobacterium johnsoniae UW101]OXG03345.1 hypothetical protein B0A63_00830 [Flavobacterium johnsoniae UW101]WQG79307.1 hypothetical protein SR927_14885 [Flavobacterium johnsoniae UW101]SHK03981.1 hypothetical protein SAMN05444146_0196 [Flavobacterium johnsoniae]